MIRELSTEEMADQPDVEPQSLRKRTPEGHAQADSQIEPKSPRLGPGSRALPKQLRLASSPALQAQLGSGLRLTQPGHLIIASLDGQSVIREQEAPLQAVVGAGRLQPQGTHGSKAVPRLAIGEGFSSQPAAGYEPNIPSGSQMQGVFTIDSLSSEDAAEVPSGSGQSQLEQLALTPRRGGCISPRAQQVNLTEQSVKFELLCGVSERLKHQVETALMQYKTQEQNAFEAWKETQGQRTQNLGTELQLYEAQKVLTIQEAQNEFHVLKGLNQCAISEAQYQQQQCHLAQEQTQVCVNQARAVALEQLEEIRSLQQQCDRQNNGANEFTVALQERLQSEKLSLEQSRQDEQTLKESQRLILQSVRSLHEKVLKEKDAHAQQLVEGLAAAQEEAQKNLKEWTQIQDKQEVTL